MQHFIMALSLYITTIFTIIMFMFGMTYYGSTQGNGNIFLYSVIGINALAVFFIIYNELFHRQRAVGSVKYYFLPVFYILCYYIETSIFGDMGDTSYMHLKDLAAVSSVAIWIGNYCCRYKKIWDVVKNLELITLICSIALVFAIPTMFLSGLGVSVGGAGDHQIVSYISAVGFGFSLYRILFQNKFGYKLFQYKNYKYIAMIFAIIQALVCLIGGGRGGFVLLLSFTFVAFVSSGINWRKIVILSILGLCFLLIIEKTTSTIGESGLERALSIFSAKNADEADSERTILYKTAFEQIMESPLCGHGIYHQYDICNQKLHLTYWHNIILDFLMQGGLIYFIIWFVILYKKYKILKKALKKDPNNFYLIPIVLYVFVLLFFSGTYLTSPFFWFVIMVVNKNTFL